MNNLQVFNFNTFQVRVVTVGDQAHFSASDVCNVLGLGNVTMTTARLEKDEFSSIEVVDAIGRQQESVFVTESGLYSLVLGSRKPEAREFKRWVTHDVLPSIRKHGMYATPMTVEAMIADPDFAIKTFTALKQEQEARKIAEQQLAIAAPKVAFADACMNSPTLVLIGDVADLAHKQGIVIGQNRLWKKLREWGMVEQRSTRPTQRALEMDILDVIERPVGEDGSILALTTKATVRGQEYIINRLMKEASS